MTISTKYDLEDMVYMVHDPEQEPYMITGIRITLQGDYYLLSRGTEGVVANERELSLEKNLSIKVLG